MSQGSLAIFFTRPFAGAMSAVALFFALPVVTPCWQRPAAGTAAAPGH